jgi:hypothetical protein
MSRLTTDRMIYQSQIKKNLTEIFGTYKPLWSYFEMTQSLTYGYSLTFLLKENSYNTRKVLFRSLKNDLLLNETQTKIFNLDRIIITETALDITLNDTFEIQALRRKDINVLETDSIILGGYYKEFTDFQSNRSYKWNIDEEMNEHLTILVAKINQINQV